MTASSICFSVSMDIGHLRCNMAMEKSHLHKFLEVVVSKQAVNQTDHLDKAPYYFFNLGLNPTDMFQTNHKGAKQFLGLVRNIGLIVESIKQIMGNKQKLNV